jgi:hypothetical protein
MSPRTVKFVEAMIRGGDNFEYNKWLKEVCEEEAQATQAQTAITRRDVLAVQVSNPINTSVSRNTRASLGPALIKPALNARALRGPPR